MLDNAVYCTKCGCMSEAKRPQQQTSNTMKTLAKVFMILGTIINASWTFGLSLCWCIPMTVIYWKKVDRGEPVSLAFKVCSLIFVSMLGGVFMLVDNDQ